MSPSGTLPPLRPLHPDGSMSQAKLREFGRLSTEELIDSLRPGEPGALKTRPDGTILDGHHRIRILRERGVDVDGLPREILARR
jgi:ParB-like chromosome segregation protein Spo0J